MTNPVTQILVTWTAQAALHKSVFILHVTIHETRAVTLFTKNWKQRPKITDVRRLTISPTLHPISLMYISPVFISNNSVMH